jgi:penicillin-binding protein 2
MFSKSNHFQQRVWSEIVRRGQDAVDSIHLNRDLSRCVWIPVILFTLGLFASACGTLPELGNAATETRPPVEVAVTRSPVPEIAIRSYYEAWQKGEYVSMYKQISKASQASIAQAEFVEYFTELQAQATLRSVEYQIQSQMASDSSAAVTVNQIWHTSLVGDIARSISIPLSNENGSWKVNWNYAMVLPELAGGNRLSMLRQPVARGTIFDRNLQRLAYDGAEVIAIGVTAGQITDEDKVDGYLSQIFGRTKGQIHALYAGKDPTWYIPVGYLSKEELAANYAALAGLDGVQLDSTTTRYYAGDGIASLLLGYTGQLSAQEVAEYRTRGYAGNEKVGKAGVEQWGEQFLSGSPAAQLLVVPPGGGNTLLTLAESAGEAGLDVITTIDRDLQNRMERYLMDDYIGAAVVMRPDTGEVLAMISNPGFDSNLFDPKNRAGSQQLAQVLADPSLPLYNRATQGQYPLGSVFKIITMSAALTAGATPGDQYDCQHYFYDTSGHAYADYTVEHKQPPQGILTLTEALERSCDTYFYHLGFDLFHQDPWIVPNMARGFGLGKATGIEAVLESKGYLPDPANKLQKYGTDWTEGDAINQAIGQGELQVTPLQVVDYVSAVANGGTLYRPNLVAGVQKADGTSVLRFAPVARGTLPVSAQTLTAVQEALKLVVVGPFGTARSAMLGMSDSVGIAGKTGTATTEGEPDAWFSAYSFSSKIPNKPNIAVAVIVEHAGEGSLMAAPMARRIFELYYYGRVLNMYRWESSYGVRGTATSIPTETPTETATPGDATAAP